mgnify:CR=1 FL=1
MGNILFFVQNTVSVDGQNSSSKFTVRVKVRADLQAAATEQTLSRSIPLAVRIAGLERISFQPQLCPLQCFKDHGTVYDQIFHQWEFAQRLQSNNASLTVPQKNGTGKTRQTIDPHGTGTHLRIMQPHSHAMGETTVPLFSHRGCGDSARSTPKQSRCPHFPQRKTPASRVKPAGFPAV